MSLRWRRIFSALNCSDFSLDALDFGALGALGGTTGLDGAAVLAGAEPAGGLGVTDGAGEVVTVLDNLFPNIETKRS